MSFKRTCLLPCHTRPLRRSTALWNFLSHWQPYLLLFSPLKPKRSKILMTICYLIWTQPPPWFLVNHSPNSLQTFSLSKTAVRQTEWGGGINLRGEIIREKWDNVWCLRALLPGCKLEKCRVMFILTLESRGKTLSQVLPWGRHQRKPQSPPPAALPSKESHRGLHRAHGGPGHGRNYRTSGGKYPCHEWNAVVPSPPWHLLVPAPLGGMGWRTVGQVLAP